MMIMMLVRTAAAAMLRPTLCRDHSYYDDCDCLLLFIFTGSIGTALRQTDHDYDTMMTDAVSSIPCT
jgi:hypothetical protein